VEIHEPPIIKKAMTPKKTYRTANAIMILRNFIDILILPLPAHEYQNSHDNWTINLGYLCGKKSN
jgi:hypothetical protein